MVLYSVPNLNKSLSMAFSIPKIKSGIALIPLLDNKFKFILSDKSTNCMTLESKEFLNSAIFIDFNLISIKQNKTDVNLEIRRKKRSIDQHYQLTNSFLNIENLIDQLFKALKLNASQILELKNRQIIDKNQVVEFQKNQIVES